VIALSHYSIQYSSDFHIPDINLGTCIPHNTLHFTLSSAFLQCNNENNIVFINLAHQYTSIAIIVEIMLFWQLCAVIYQLFLCCTLYNLIISLPTLFLISTWNPQSRLVIDLVVLQTVELLIWQNKWKSSGHLHLIRWNYKVSLVSWWLKNHQVSLLFLVDAILMLVTYYLRNYNKQSVPRPLDVEFDSQYSQYKSSGFLWILPLFYQCIILTQY